MPVARGPLVPAGAWITPFRAPAIPPIPRELPAAPRAPISPATLPSPAGAAPGTVVPPPFSCGWGGLWETDGGVDRDEVEPPLLWPPHDAPS